MGEFQEIRQKPGPKAKENLAAVFAEQNGICEKSARKILNTGYSPEGQAILLEQCKRVQRMRELRVQNSDYRKIKSAGKSVSF